jgi:hypothetical protein
MSSVASIMPGVIYGQITGVYYGENGIPDLWLSFVGMFFVISVIEIKNIMQYL